MRRGIEGVQWMGLGVERGTYLSSASDLRGSQGCYLKLSGESFSISDTTALVASRGQGKSSSAALELNAGGLSLALAHRSHDLQWRPVCEGWSLAQGLPGR